MQINPVNGCLDYGLICVRREIRVRCHTK